MRIEICATVRGVAERAPSVFAAALGFDDLVGALRALAEPTRLRLVVLLGKSELTVTEITQVVGQSQPRVSRHLRLLVDAGILDRTPEGAFVFYALGEGRAAAFAGHLAQMLPPADTVIAGDLAALERVRSARSRAAAAYLSEHRGELEALSGLHVPEVEVERAMLALLAGEGPIGRLLDIGTGTGRILELLAPLSERSIGLDVDHEMLALARATLGDAQLTRVSVRHGDLHRPPFEAGSFDAAVMHNVLHLLDEPGDALVDAARLLRPGGRLLVVDLAPHQLESLRADHGHRRLGIADLEMRTWAGRAGLEIEAQQLLAPESGEPLTVVLWLLRARSRGRHQAGVA